MMNKSKFINHGYALRRKVKNLTGVRSRIFCSAKFRDDKGVKIPGLMTGGSKIPGW